ncbi:Gfo/Idh/MocA family oxidoreductase [Luteolibacter ambystomatis]|uniref:Gfo/Idh/MocA family oxidoreductase n=1 Tax=Luteolibacter ambystomatis TaxID=2824561 RepID=A0A975J2A8_9BACT|nr:Gfo/Idh/MocA family oxidoreductase [Luteolibacter ambystomatis]QUE52730.1 Gfo/Idh/MocA family oxidoreductase [Luteolibacter ambystomatis]
MNRKIRMGMVGGGRGAFIGAVHRMAANLDGQIELVCGAFSSDPQRSKDSGADFFLPPDRCYPDWKTMIEAEAKLPEGERMDFVAIVTPNHVHFPPAKYALEHGFHVLSDKPATFNLTEAKALQEIVKKSGQLYGLTHNYTGYPLVKEARDLIAAGKLGKIRKVVVEYPQGWLSNRIEEGGQKQAAWRTDPKKSGAAGCIGDIGTHAENLAEYITGLKIKELAADITAFVKGRKLDDDGNVLLRFKGGAKGILHASQISAGEENNLNIRVYGELGGIEWRQMEPNTLIVKWLDKPTEIYRTGLGYLGANAAAAARIPAGHPEGYLEAFANIYRNFAGHIRAKLNGRKVAKGDPVLDYPTIADGVRGMAFIDAVVQSSKANAAWTPLEG